MPHPVTHYLSFMPQPCFVCTLHHPIPHYSSLVSACASCCSAPAACLAHFPNRISHSWCCGWPPEWPGYGGKASKLFRASLLKTGTGHPPPLENGPPPQPWKWFSRAICQEALPCLGAAISEREAAFTLPGVLATKYSRHEFQSANGQAHLRAETLRGDPGVLLHPCAKVHIFKRI